MKMIIEFMYQRVKSLILRCMTPIQLINMTTLLVLAQTNEYNNQQNINALKLTRPFFSTSAVKSS